MDLLSILPLGEMTGDQYLDRLQNELTVTEAQDLREGLVMYVQTLLFEDFNRLILLLYRVDVSEEKLKKVLDEHPYRDAADIIADLIIERSQQKALSRRQHNANDNIPDEDRW